MWETAGAATLRRAWAVPPTEGGIGSIGDVDSMAFALFALSVLWRCHVSSGPVFKAVNLGPHAESIRTLLLEGRLGDHTRYPVAMYRVEGAGDIPLQVIFSPTTTRIERHRTYHFLACGFRWSFVVTKHAKAVAGHLPILVGKFPDTLRWGVVRYAGVSAFNEYLAMRALQSGVSLGE